MQAKAGRVGKGHWACRPAGNLSLIGRADPVALPSRLRTSCLQGPWWVLPPHEASGAIRFAERTARVDRRRGRLHTL